MEAIKKVQEVHTKFGTLYVESYWQGKHLEEDSRVYFQDSNHNSFDFYHQDFISEWAQEENKTEQEVVDGFVSALEEMNTIEELLDWFPLQYELITQDSKEVDEWFTEEDGGIFVDYDFVINIGDYYIVFRAY